MLSPQDSSQLKNTSQDQIQTSEEGHVPLRWNQNLECHQRNQLTQDSVPGWVSELLENDTPQIEKGKGQEKDNGRESDSTRLGTKDCFALEGKDKDLRKPFEAAESQSCAFLCWVHWEIKQVAVDLCPF